MDRTVTIRTELGSILFEQALAMARELEMASDVASDGQVLAVSDSVALRAGRELTRRASEATLQRQAEAAEEKGPPGGPAPAEAAASPWTGHPGPR